ncbi:Ankyrin repeat-containing domain [Pseudocohnilembus persalinus]|uniref:Ankyrin repeat-containing domain n=1 Tax=Pseudocohnilembus persalinus TaxID=266149 RepID=A0A0V0QS64_PSEPJ|nr:Ankyrin repeat-containing domain [Pseudocohnilembus persalinus]|eukprot:KRX04983.1 Ankyrin repeat-containing domain [Pseudocohnilembus persalinus]
MHQKPGRFLDFKENCFSTRSILKKQENQCKEKVWFYTPREIKNNQTIEKGLNQRLNKLQEKEKKKLLDIKQNLDSSKDLIYDKDSNTYFFQSKEYQKSERKENKNLQINQQNQKKLKNSFKNISIQNNKQLFQTSRNLYNNDIIDSSGNINCLNTSWEKNKKCSYQDCSKKKELKILQTIMNNNRFENENDKKRIEFNIQNVKLGKNVTQDCKIQVDEVEQNNNSELKAQTQFDTNKDLNIQQQQTIQNKVVFPSQRKNQIQNDLQSVKVEFDKNLEQEQPLNKPKKLNALNKFIQAAIEIKMNQKNGQAQQKSDLLLQIMNPNTKLEQNHDENQNKQQKQSKNDIAQINQQDLTQQGLFAQIFQNKNSSEKQIYINDNQKNKNINMKENKFQLQSQGYENKQLENNIDQKEEQIQKIMNRVLITMEKKPKFLKQIKKATVNKQQIRRRFISFCQMLKDHNLKPKDFIKNKVFSTKPFEKQGGKQFFEFVKQNNVQECKNMLRFNKYLLYDVNHFGMTPLVQACKLKYYIMAKELIQSGSFLDDEDMLGRSSLYFSIQNQDLQLFKLLLYSKASPWNKSGTQYEQLCIQTKNPVFVNALQQAKKMHIISKVVPFKVKDIIWNEQLSNLKKVFE